MNFDGLTLHAHILVCPQVVSKNSNKFPKRNQNYINHLMFLLGFHSESK